MARSGTPFLLIFLYLLPISLCNAQNPSSKLDDVLTRGTLRIGTTGDYKPFTYLDQAANQFEGFDIDLAHSLGEALGVKVEFVKTSWPTLMQDFTEGKFDVAMGGISFTFDRAKKAYFSDPYIREGKTPIARCEKGGKFQTLAEIRPARSSRNRQPRRHQRKVRESAFEVSADRRIRGQCQDFR
jgi:cyclohexadienyl dehydratase